MRVILKHRLVLNDAELDSIRASLGQVMAKGTIIPDLVRLDYKLERLRQTKQRIRKSKEDIDKTSGKPQGDTSDALAKPQGGIIRIISS